MPKIRREIIFAIITAGGCGKRMNHKEKKQFIQLQGRPVLFWTLDRFVQHPAITRCVVTLPPDELEQMNNRIQAEYPDSAILCVAGGKQRQDSVLCGLDACDPATDIVLVHDGVRPFVSEDTITRLIEAARETGAAIPVCPVKNTIKHLENGWVAETVPRKNLVEVYTPQVFSYDLLYRLHKQALKDHRYFTDDAAILEYYRKPIITIETSDRNLKITRPFDLEIAAILLEKGSYK